jgi:membrane-bound inhibitor of C-type lysozyme
MDLEQLTKHQIVLLTLLVSFVTSIATGIVTVSLVNQAPPSVTRTINQIVEHTVEKVVPATQGATAAAATTVTERTVVVKDDDLAAQSIAKMQQSLARITQKGSDLLLTRGVIVSGSGTAYADREALGATRQLEAILADGKRYPVVLRPFVRGQTIAVLDIAVGTSTGFTAAPLADLSKVQLGQSVIRIGGGGSDTVGMGVVASLPDSHAGLIESSVSSATPGSVLITLFGEVVGVSTGGSRQTGSYFYTIPDPSLSTPAAS